MRRIILGVSPRGDWMSPQLDPTLPVGQGHAMARNAVKIAVSVEVELLARAERLRNATGESRSALAYRALRRLLRAEAHAATVREYVEAYRRSPESADEVLAARTLSALPWDD